MQKSLGGIYEHPVHDKNASDILQDLTISDYTRAKGKQAVSLGPVPVYVWVCFSVSILSAIW